MAVTLPQIVVSRDGQRAISLEQWLVGPFFEPSPDGSRFEVAVRLESRGQKFAAQFKVSDSLRVMWSLEGQTRKWDEDFALARQDLALIAAGEYLDDNPVPASPEADHYAFQLPITSYLFDIFTQDQPTDQELREYVEGKIYWAWRFRVQPSRLEPWEARRLGASVEELDQAAFTGIGSRWERDAVGRYSALPQFPPAFEAKLTSGAGRTRAGTPYEVALSFAGEQRPFVQRVAATLRDAGVNVFYDDFADLWGKDLTKELERVYRKESRYVVVFVSQEYVDKAWPNLERQHALAGRMERMDDSVLPARFSAVELPGLPATVGYLDVGERTPADLAKLIIRKLRASDA